MNVRYQPFGLCLWAVLLVLGLVQVARAQGSGTVDQYCFNNNLGSCAGTWKNTPAQACAEGAAFYTAARQGVDSQVCTVTLCSGNLDVPPRQFACRLTFGLVYHNGLTYRSAAGSLPCPSAGTKSTRNFTYAFDNSPNGGLDVTSLTAAVGLAGTSLCAVGDGASCSVTLGAFPTQAWTSTKPTATGLYRHSVDYEVTHTGSSCTPSAAEKRLSDAVDVVPPCPGAFGTVNGTPTCIPTGPKTTRDRPLRSDGTDVPVNAGNPAAGSRGSDPLANRSPATGANNGNNGSTPAASDGSAVKWGGGLTSTAGTSSASGSSLKAEDIKTDCDKRPNSIGCSEYGTPDGSVQLGRSESGFSSIGVVSFAGGGSCPPPLSFSVAGHQYAIAYDPICNNATSYIRPVVLVLGAALAAFIFANGFKS
jgi:hypothetical protein